MEKDAMRFYFLQDWESKKGKTMQKLEKNMEKRTLEPIQSLPNDRKYCIHLGPD